MSFMLSVTINSVIMLYPYAECRGTSPKANGREHKSRFGQVFNFKLGCFCYVSTLSWAVFVMFQL
jgi:hypothetical protein